MYCKESIPLNKVDNKVNIEFSLASSIIIEENIKPDLENSKRDSF